MGKIATQEDFNDFLQDERKNIPIILRGMWNPDDAKKLKANWRKWAKANGFNYDLKHLSDSANATLKQEEEKKLKRKSKY